MVRPYVKINKKQGDYFFMIGTKARYDTRTSVYYQKLSSA